MIPRLARLTSLLLLAAGSGGCFWAVVGGAGAEAGYVASQDERGAGETVSDQWIHAKVKSALIGASGVSSGDIKVKVRKGVVTLKGVVDSAHERQKAVAAARDVKGVKSVIDKLHVSK